MSEQIRIPFSPPDITEAEIAEVADALRSGWITTGPKTKQLERELAAFLGTPRVACLGSATAALECALRALGIGPGDEVITSAYTYTASCSPICHVGATPVLCDVAPGSYEMDYAQLERLITPRTKAIIPVDLGGVMCDYDALFAAIDAAFAAGWRRCKLYFMVGLPTETDDDIKGIASLAQRAYDRAKAAVPPEQRGSVRMSVSCAVFVPKAQTPFQWDGQISPEETLRRVGLLKRSVKYKAVDVHYHDPATSFVEAVMSRGGREVADWVEAAWRRGARFDAWTELFNEEAWTGAAEELGLDPSAIAQAEFPTDYVLPWAHITAAVSPKFLARERERAAAGITTPDCTFENCSACGACPTLGVDIELQQEREGKEAAPAANPYRKVVHPREAEPPCYSDQAQRAEGSTDKEAIR